jgi:hypothetical protein
MNTQLEALRQQRQLILERMQALGPLRRGSLSRQFFKSKEPKARAARGPYFVLQGYVNGRKFSQRVPADQAPQVQEQVENYRLFLSLAEEFVAVCDQITQLESQDSKKNSSRPRSPRRGSKKPKPS